MTPPLPCGCDPSDTRRCTTLRQLARLRKAMASQAEHEPDPERRSRLWRAHHGYTVQIAAHLCGEGVAR
jgi:hypothetical protein